MSRIRRLFGVRRAAHRPPLASPGRKGQDARLGAVLGLDPPATGLSSDLAATSRRRALLEGYFAREVLGDEGFVCRNGAACRAAAEARGAGAYHEGQLSYLGPRYDLMMVECR